MLRAPRLLRAFKQRVRWAASRRAPEAREKQRPPGSARRPRPSPPLYEPLALRLSVLNQQAADAAGAEQGALFEGEPGLAEDLDFIAVDLPAREAEPEQAGTSEAALIQAKIAGARSLGHVLEIVSDHADDLDCLHAATALYRLARLGPRRSSAEAFASDPVRTMLVKRLAEPEALEVLSAQARVCLLWALARLSLSPVWLPKVLGLCADSAPGFSGHQLATALHSLAKLEAAGLVQLQKEEPQRLLEAVHSELRRRQKALGPGATSAMDTILIADGLAKLQIRDDGLFTSLASALRAHIKAGELGVREVRHAASAFSLMGFVDAKLASALMNWLSPRLESCGGDDLSALAYSLSRAEVARGAHRSFFQALRAEVPRRLAAGELSSKESAGLLVSFSQAGMLEPDDREAQKLVKGLSSVIARSPSALNGQWLALSVPCLSPFAADSRPVLDVLGDRATQLAPMLSPRQLARLAVGFGEGQVKVKTLWQSLTKEALARASAFSAPDVLRVLAGFDAANIQHPGLLKTFWALASDKQAKYLVEELLALLQMWPRVPVALRPDPDSLMKSMRLRLEKGSRGVGWYAPAELAIELIEWLPASRALTDRGLDTRLLRATLAQLPRQLQSATPGPRRRLLSTLTLQDEEIAAKARNEAQQSEVLQRALATVAQDVVSTARQHTMQELAADTAFGCAALGFDGSPLQELLGELLQVSVTEVQMAARICWACAEVNVHAGAARALISQMTVLAQDVSPVSDIADKVSFLRLAWALLVLDGPESELRKLLAAGDAGDVEGDQLLAALTPLDLRPLQQLAWHCQQHFPEPAGHWSTAVLAAGPQAPRSASAQSHGLPPQTEAEKTLSTLLQHLRIPHVVASPAAVPGGIYRIPVWFPEQGAALELEQLGDRLASGGLSGTARLRRRQLRDAGLKMHAFDPSAFRGTSQLRRLRAVAEVVAPSCPEAAAWLRSSEAARARAEDLQQLAAGQGASSELAQQDAQG